MSLTDGFELAATELQLSAVGYETQKRVDLGTAKY
jgi:hypothetical protein